MKSEHYPVASRPCINQISDLLPKGYVPTMRLVREVMDQLAHILDHPPSVAVLNPESIVFYNQVRLKIADDRAFDEGYHKGYQACRQ
jgi:hypothetical protein